MIHNISKTGKVTCAKCKGKGRLIDNEFRIVYCNVCDGNKVLDWIDSVVKSGGDGKYSGFDKIEGIAFIVNENELERLL